MKVGAAIAATPKPIRPRAMPLMANAELEEIGLGFCFAVVLGDRKASMGDDLVIGWAIFVVFGLNSQMRRVSLECWLLMCLNVECFVRICMAGWHWVI